MIPMIWFISGVGSGRVVVVVGAAVVVVRATDLPLLPPQPPSATARNTTEPTKSRLIIRRYPPPRHALSDALGASQLGRSNSVGSIDVAATPLSPAARRTVW